MEKKPFLIGVQHGSHLDELLKKMFKKESRVVFTLYTWPKIKKAYDKFLKKGMIVGLEVTSDQLKKGLDSLTILTVRYCNKNGIKLIPLFPERYTKIYGEWKFYKIFLTKALKKPIPKYKDYYISKTLYQKTMIHEIKRKKLDAAIIGAGHLKSMSEELKIPPKKQLMVLTPSFKLLKKFMGSFNEYSIEKGIKWRKKFKEKRKEKWRKNFEARKRI